MLAALKPEYDVVYGAPQEEQHGLLRDLASRHDKDSSCQHHGRRDRPQRERPPSFRTRLRDGFQESALVDDGGRDALNYSNRLA